MALTPTTTRLAIEAASALGRKGTRVLSIEVVTPDGRTWAIDPKATGCFRLFEIDHDRPDRGPEEHHAVDGDEWHLSDLLDYLDAIGRPRGTTGAT